MIADSPFFLGLDCGGTGCRAVLLGANGNPIGTGSGGAANIASTPQAVLRSSVQQAVESAYTSAGLSIASLCAPLRVCSGCAGWSAAEKRVYFHAFLQLLTDCSDCDLLPDYEIALFAACQQEPGVLLSAGTGAVAIGRSRTGEVYRQDGLGYLLGDRGSGYQIGLDALKHAASKLQLHNSQDALTLAVLKAIGAADLPQLLGWLYPEFQTAKVAALAECVCELAEAKDEIALGIVSQAAADLISTVGVVRQKLKLEAGGQVYVNGSLLAKNTIVRRLVEANLGRSPLQLRTVTTSPAEAAALLALKTWNEKQGMEAG
jgi:N-acetylglucosamine kinase-like BadF-type ATPase